MKVDLFRPSVSSREVRNVLEVLASGWWGMGPRVAEFEKKFGEYTGAEAPVAVNSGTAALHLALKLAGIGPGDEVIVPTLTFCSTAHVVNYCGAVPIFADVDPLSLNITAAEINRLRTKRTRAVIVVHFGGRPADMGEIVSGDCLGPVECAVIEDCAHAMGSRYCEGGLSGTPHDHVGWFRGCFSFHAVKNLACGDGGMLTCAPHHAKRARELRWMGIDKSTCERVTATAGKYGWEYEIEEIGYKYHMNDLTASIGLAQLERLDVMNAHRRAIAGQYLRALEPLTETAGGCVFPDLRLPPEDTRASVSSWHLFWIWAQERDALRAHLAEAGITTGVHYRPLHTFPVYGRRERLPVAESAAKHLLSLPMHGELTSEQAQYVITKIKEFYSK